MQEIKIWYMKKPESLLDDVIYKILWDFEIQIAHQMPARNSKEEKRICHLVEFAIQVDYTVKIKESEKTDKYSDLTMRLMVILIEVDALGTVPKDLIKERGGIRNWRKRKN